MDVHFSSFFLTGAVVLQLLNPHAAKGSVDYWLWGGVKPAPRMQNAHELYLLQGELSSAKESGGLHFQGLSPYPLVKPALVLVLRVRELLDPEQWLPLFLTRASHWERKGAQIIGVQIDFDSATARLSSYAVWLKEVRTRLPVRYALSVTGLADWSTQGAPADLNKISEQASEVVFQLYRGKSPIEGLENYLHRLSRVRIPFKLGLLEGMTLRAEAQAELELNPRFAGWVIFLGRNSK